MTKIVAVIALAGFLPQAALAADPASPTLAERVSNTWATMGLGMHVMLGKVGIGDLAGKRDAAAHGAANAIVADTVDPVPAVVVSQPPARGWAEWAANTGYAAGLGTARAADAAWGFAYDGTLAAAPYAGQAWSLTRDAGLVALDATASEVAMAAPYAGQAWDATRRLGAASYVIGADGLRASVAYMPDAIDWTADFAAAGATAFIVPAQDTPGTARSVCLGRNARPAATLDMYGSVLENVKRT